VLHDTKEKDVTDRLGLLALSVGAGLTYKPVSIDWSEQIWRASDLESICALQGRPGQFLAAESGYWKNRYGRVFHLDIVKRAGRWGGNILGVM